MIFDTDNGFSGKVQFGISLRDCAVADISKSEALKAIMMQMGALCYHKRTAIFA